MSRSEDTKERILEQAAALFNRRGFAGAAMSDIMEATGLQKGGIYWHFGSKEELALQAFDFALARLGDRFRGPMDSESTSLGKLHAFVDAFRGIAVDPPLPGGCPVMNTAVEADDGNPALRERARNAMGWLRARVRRTAEAGMAAGELRADLDADQLATVLVSTMEGALVLSRLYGETTHVDQAAAHLHRWLDDGVRARA